MRRESLHFRADITFWLAILVLLATMLSRHAGRTPTQNQNFYSAEIEALVTGRSPAP